MEQFSVLHFEFRAAVDDFCLLLKLNHGNCLVHHRTQSEGFLIHVQVPAQRIHLEQLAWVILIHLHGEGGKWKEVDAVAILQGWQIAISQGDAKHIADACSVACCSAKPFDVVVSPYDVEVIVVAQRFHDEMRSRSSVEDVAQQVQAVYGKFLNQLAYLDDEFIGTLRVDNRLHNHVVVLMLLLAVCTIAFVQQFLDDIAEFLRQFLADFRAGIFR